MFLSIRQAIQSIICYAKQLRRVYRVRTFSFNGCISVLCMHTERRGGIEPSSIDQSSDVLFASVFNSIQCGTMLEVATHVVVRQCNGRCRCVEPRSFSAWLASAVHNLRSHKTNRNEISVDVACNNSSRKIFNACYSTVLLFVFACLATCLSVVESSPG